ncbi:MAG: hypothetical protein ACKOTZ_11385 [Chloroflexota bacterium]
MAAATPSAPSPAPRNPPPAALPHPLAHCASALAALSVLTVGLVAVPAAPPVEEPVADLPVAREVIVERRVRYVRLKRGHTPPPGARVIDAAEPTPRLLVTRIAAPAPERRSRPVARTRQSGG